MNSGTNSLHGLDRISLSWLVGRLIQIDMKELATKVFEEPPIFADEEYEIVLSSLHKADKGLADIVRERVELNRNLEVFDELGD